jgi:hypothetical protein
MLIAVLSHDLSQLFLARLVGNTKMERCIRCITSECGINIGDCAQIANTVSNINGHVTASTASGIDMVNRRTSRYEVVPFDAGKIDVVIIFPVGLKGVPIEQLLNRRLSFLSWL